MAAPNQPKTDGKVYRRFKEHDSTTNRSMPDWIFEGDETYKCPEYVLATPPCQGSCPSGEDIRGWLNIVRGIEKPPVGGVSWQEYAFRRMTAANPFPSVMGRVCPAPCEKGCNRNQVEDNVGINAVEHFIGEWGIANNMTFTSTAEETGKKVAIIGGGPAGLSVAYQLRLKGHSCTVFDEHAELGGMMRYGIPGFRTPRSVLDTEIKRITDLGVEVKLKTRVGTDITLEQLEKDFDAVFMGMGAQSGRPLPIDGADAPNCVTAMAFLKAFNDGRLQHVGSRVVVIGGGDTSIDVATVARRLGNITKINESDRPEHVIAGHVAHDVAAVSARQGAEVTLITRASIEKMNAAKAEVDHALSEGIEIRGNLTPVAVIKGADGRATALRVAEFDMVKNDTVIRPGTEFDIPADLIVSAIGQAVDFTGLDGFDNGKGLMKADKNYQVPNRPGFFVGGDVLLPHLLTTAIGHGSIAADSIHHYLQGNDLDKRPKVDVHFFDVTRKLVEKGLPVAPYDHVQATGTDSGNYAVHNFEDRSSKHVIPSNELFLGHFMESARFKRGELNFTAAEALGNFEERLMTLSEKDTIAEAKRCMSCGLCFECDNCVIYCPQVAVFKVKRDKQATGRYVDTDYGKCIGCHICADVCPTGYIKMGMGD